MKTLQATNLSLQDAALAKTIPTLSSIVLVVVNSLLVIAIRQFSLFERHETTTKLNVSVSFKLTLARFINSSAILIAVNDDSSRWFDVGNLVQSATSLMIAMALQQPIMYAINIPGIVKWVKKKIEMAKGENSKMT
jgi:uncharacterized membrane protein YeiB